MDVSLGNFEKLERVLVGKMKTLDEVIETAPYVGTEWTNDALHYLKEYRSDKAMWEADRKGYLNWIEQYKEAREKHQQAVIEMKKNPPLSWAELREMEGKPVWVEVDDRKEWGIIADFYTDMFLNGKVTIRIRDTRSFRLCEKMLGKTWQAYRKEHGTDS